MSILKELNLVNRAILFFEVLFAITLLLHSVEWYEKLVHNRLIEKEHLTLLDTDACRIESVMVQAGMTQRCIASKEWVSMWPSIRSLHEILLDYKVFHQGEFQQSLAWVAKAVFFMGILIVAAFSYQITWIKKKVEERTPLLPSSKAIKHE